jgi:hypothetical protein
LVATACDPSRRRRHGAPTSGDVWVSGPFCALRVVAGLDPAAHHLNDGDDGTAGYQSMDARVSPAHDEGESPLHDGVVAMRPAPDPARLDPPREALRPSAIVRSDQCRSLRP